MDNREQSEKERNTANNTNNIRNAAKVAEASANPYAKAAGTAVNLADKVTGGKVTEKAGDVVTKGLERAPMGNQIQDASNKLSESGASDAIGNTAGAMGGIGGSATKTSGGTTNRMNSSSSTPSSNNMTPTGNNNSFNNNANNISNRTGNKRNDDTPNALKNRESRRGNNNYYSYNNSNTPSNKENEDSKDKEDNNNENKNESNNSEEETTKKEEQERKKRIKIIFRVLPILMFVGMFLLIGVLCVLAIVAPILSAYSWFVNLFHHKTDKAKDYEINNENQQEQLAAERAYMDAIVGSQDGSVKGIITTYEEEYGVKIDWYLLNAIITYRYSAADIDKIYVNDDDVEIDETEFDNNLQKLDETDENSQSTDDNSGIDYTKAKEKIETVAKLMIIGENGLYKTDNVKDGEVYNKLLNSDFLTTYYKEILPDNPSNEAKKELVDDIYDYAAGAREFLEEDPKEAPVPVASNSSIIHLQTCEKLSSVGYYRTKKVNGFTIFDNPTAAPGSTYPDYLDFKDYLRGVLYREIGIDASYKEALKAQAIAAFTYLIHDSRSGFDMKTGEMYFPSGTCRQVTCSPTHGCTQRQVSGGIYTFYIGNTGMGSHNFRPMNETELSIADEAINDVFGKIMVKSGVTSSSFTGSKDTVQAAYLDSSSTSGFVTGKTFSQQGAMKDARAGMKYTDILKKYYSGLNYDIIDISEGLYTTVDFANQEFTGEVKYYNQGNYSGTTFCKVSGKTIQGSGCGIVSAAIVAVSLTGNTKYDPIYMNNLARNGTDCGSDIRGINDSFFKYMAGNLSLKYEEVSKDQSDRVVIALKSGKSLVIAHMGPGEFTEGGHYIVLGAINDKGEVKVYDPGHRNKTEKWYSLNMISNQLKESFHIFTKN